MPDNAAPLHEARSSSGRSAELRGASRALLESTDLEQIRNSYVDERRPDRSHAEQQRLRKDVRRLAAAFRQIGLSGHDVVRSLIAVMFIKLHEDYRASNGLPSRFSPGGFVAYRAELPDAEREGEYKDRTIHHLLERGIKADPLLARLLAPVGLSRLVSDSVIENKVLAVLDGHRLLASHLDPVGAAFEALAMRGGKDTQSGQFFTPEPIVRFAVNVVQPDPADEVLDPAVGTGRFLTASMDYMAARVRERPPGAGLDVRPSLRAEQFRGADLDEWVATIARMNLFVRGAGASRIEVENGLSLADAAAVGKDASLLGAVDTCLTNPPLASIVHHGRGAKGGALFLAAIHKYLKPVRNPAAGPEWRGGKLGIILDDAILNTPEYARTREFIRSHYFVKAVFSIHRDAFWYQARTTAKTSLVYLVRRPDDGVMQEEPIFYANIKRIGFTSKGHPAPSDLATLLQAYRHFERVVLESYRGASFDTGAARCALELAESPPGAFVHWLKEGEAGDARLDFAANAVLHLRDTLRPDLPVLGDFVNLEVRNPPEDPSGIYGFATIDRTTGEVRAARTESTQYGAANLRVIREGDIVVSGIDMVNGSVGYATRDVSGRVVSREFYTLAVKPECAGGVDARFLALLLQTQRAREMVVGSVTGTSNRTRIESASLLRLPLPPLPPLEAQRMIVAELDKSRRARKTAETCLANALAKANRFWAASVSRGGTQPEQGCSVPGGQ